jgi:hypothetical protein
MRHIFAIGGVALALCSCATGLSAFGHISSLRVTGYSGESVTCASFKPDASAVTRFFAKAIVVSGQTLHDQYEIYPCSATGVFSAGHEQWSWTMHLGGTAVVTSAGGESFSLADPAQASSLAGQ